MIDWIFIKIIIFPKEPIQLDKNDFERETERRIQLGLPAFGNLGLSSASLWPTTAKVMMMMITTVHSNLNSNSFYAALLGSGNVFMVTERLNTRFLGSLCVVRFARD